MADFPIVVEVYDNDDLVTPTGSFETAIEAAGENVVNGIGQNNYILVAESDATAIALLAIDKIIVATQADPVNGTPKRIAIFICKSVSPEIKDNRKMVRFRGPNLLYELTNRNLGNAYIAHRDTGTISATGLTTTTAKIIPGDADYKSDDYYNGWTLLTADGYIGIVEDYRSSDGLCVLAGTWQPDDGTTPDAGEGYELKSGVTDEDVNQVMEYAPPGWSVQYTAGGATGTQDGTSFVAAGETVFDGLKKIQEMSGEVFVDEDGYVPYRHFSWIDTPSTSAGTFRNDVSQTNYELGIYIPILELTRKRSEMDRVTRLTPYGNNNLTIAMASGLVSVPTGFSVDFANNLIINTAAETAGASIRYAVNTWPAIKIVSNDDLPSTETVPEEAAAVALFNASIAWLTAKAALRYEYTIKCQPTDIISPGHYYDIDYNGKILITASAFVHKVQVFVGEDGLMQTTVYLTSDHYEQPKTGANTVATMLRDVREWQRHNVGGGALYLTAGGPPIVPPGISDHGGLTGLGDDDHSQYALLNGRDGDILLIDQVRAYDGAGLKLYDDGGNGLFVQDGGLVLIDTGLTIDLGANNTGLKIEGASGQSSNLITWADNSGNVLGGVDERGVPFADLDTNATNLFYGEGAGNASLTENNNTGIGYKALQIVTGKENTALGSSALASLTSGEKNTALGYFALYNLESGGSNVAIGHAAGRNTTSGAGNFALGRNSLYSNVGGSNNAVIGTTAGFNILGDGNVFIGSSAGFTTTGAYNIFIGYNAGYNATGSNKLYIENSSGADPLIYGEFDNDIVVINGELHVTDSLGVGTTSPAEILEIVANGGVGSTESPALQIRDSFSGTRTAANQPWGKIDFYSDDSSGAGAGKRARIAVENDNESSSFTNLGFYISSSDNVLTKALHLNYTADVGMGTDAPEYKLHVVGSAGIDGDLTFVGAQAINTTAGDLTMQPAGDLILSPTGTDVLYPTAVDQSGQNWISGFLGAEWGIDTGLGHIDARSAYFDELRVTLFSADETLVLAGSHMVSPGMGKISRDFTLPAVAATGTIYFRDSDALPDAPIFKNNSWVMIRVKSTDGSGLTIAMVWGVVSNYTDLSGGSDGEQSWTWTTKSLGAVWDIGAPPEGTASQVIPAESVGIGFGVSGDGWVMTTVNDLASGPYMSINTWSGANPYTAANRTQHIRMGDLNGIAGIGHQYGLYAGVSPSGPRIIVSDVEASFHQIPISLYSGTNEGGYIRLNAIRFDSDVESDIVPDGDWTSENVEGVGGGGAPYSNYIDEDPASPGSDYLRNTPGMSGYFWFLLSDISHTLTTLDYDLYGSHTTITDDVCKLTIQIFKDDMTTPLTDEVVVLSNTTSESRITGSFTGVDTTASDAEWSTARLLVRWVYHVGGGDEVIKLEPNMELGPYIAIGNPLPAVYFGENTTGFWAGRDPDDDEYKVRIGGGNDTSARASLTYNQSGLKLWASDDHTTPVIALDNSGNSYFAGVMTIATAGEIRQGTGTWGSDFDGIRIYNNSNVGNVSAYYDDEEVARITQTGFDVIIEDSTSFSNQRALTFSNSSGDIVLGVWGRYSTGNDYETRIGSGDPNYTTGILSPTTTLFSFGDTDERAVVEIRAQNENDGNARLTIEVGSDINGSVCNISVPTAIDGGLYVGDSATASSVTDGQLVLYQGGNDGAILEARSSDVTGMTTQGMADDNTYFAVQKFSATTGGAFLLGGGEGDYGMVLRGSANTANTATSTSAVAPVMLRAAVDAVAPGSSDNLVVIQGGSTAQAIFKGNGDLRLNGVVGAAFDAYDDVHLVRAAALLSPDAIRSTFDDFVQYNRADLEAAGLIENSFWSVSGFMQLQSGAIWQLHKRIAELENKLYGNSRRNIQS